MLSSRVLGMEAQFCLDEGGILAAAGFLDGFDDDQLLAGAGLAVDQHMGIAVGGLQDLLLDTDHLAILRDDVLQRLVGGVVAFGEGADEADVEASRRSVTWASL